MSMVSLSRLAFLIWYSMWPLTQTADEFLQTNNTTAPSLAYCYYCVNHQLSMPLTQLLPAAWAGSTGQCSVYLSQMSMILTDDCRECSLKVNIHNRSKLKQDEACQDRTRNGFNLLLPSSKTCSIFILPSLSILFYIIL